MSKRKHPRQAAKPGPSRWKRRVWTLAFLAVSAIVLLLFGRGWLARAARAMAAGQLSSGAISAALVWLDRADRLDPSDGQTELMRATCYRQLERADRWGKTLRSAERKGASAEHVEREILLCAIQMGELPQGAETQFNAMIERGAPISDVAAAFVQGYLSRAEPQKAKLLLDAWAADWPDEPHVNYVRALYLRWWGDLAGAQREFEHALAIEPRHELARAALAGLFEDRRAPDRALRQYVQFAAHSPASVAATVGLARMMRITGHLGEARALVEPFLARTEPPGDALAEIAQIELESGDYDEAQRRFDQADDKSAKDGDTVSQAITLALRGEILGSERLFDQVRADNARSRRIDDLEARLTVAPNDEDASGELADLRRSSFEAFLGSGDPNDEPEQDKRQDRAPASAGQLYALHCSACHGADGNGRGRAARHLFPKPRDLRTGKTRLVSTRNGIPTLEDIETVIRDGMPGTAMPAFDNLDEEQVRMLAREVLRLNREGVRRQFVDTLESQGEPIDESDVHQVVELCTTPGQAIDVPPIADDDDRAIARGKDAYFALGCNKCHGDDATGDSQTRLFDDKGRPSPPRDLVHDPFKGGHQTESLYLRIYAGMPGTPHPACYNAPQQQLIDLVHYCRRLSQEPKQTRTNHQRAVDAVSRPYPWPPDAG